MKLPALIAGRASVAGIALFFLLLITRPAAAQTNCTGSANLPAQAVCTAAESFLATLTSSQRSNVVYDFNRATASTKWSNLPCGSSCHNGLMFGSLTGAQLTAALAVAQTALSAAGYGTFDGIRKADAYLNLIGAGSVYSDTIYFIAFIGTPSSSKEWILQLGGHHYALNFYYHGSTESPTPYFTGINPSAFTLNGVSYVPMKNKADAMKAMLSALSTTELAAAKLSGSFDDVLLGPGDDDAFPAPSGLDVSTLDAAKQALVTAAIEAWVNDMPGAVASDFRSAYTSTAALANTKIGWSGSTQLAAPGSYIRIDGPRVWIEITTQAIVGPSQLHYHSVWRDEMLDYGGDGSHAGEPGAVAFTSANYAVAEGAGTVTIEIQRTGGSDGAATVAYSVSGGSATAGADFENTSGVLTWIAGETASKSFLVTLLNDTVPEASETIEITLQNASGVSLGAVSTTVIGIADDDHPPGPRRRAVRH